MEEGWTRSVKKGISSPALHSVSPTCRARGSHFSILRPADFLANVVSSPPRSCVYVCPSPTLTFLPLLASAFFMLLSPPPLSSPAQIWGRSCFIAAATRDPLETCYTHNKHTHCSAAAVKLSLTFTHRSVVINQRRNEREQPSSCGCCKSVLVWGERGRDAEGP